VDPDPEHRLWIWIRIGHPGSVLGMQIDNLQTKLVSCLSQRLLYLCRYIFFT
jgi:hypothetical protein